MMNCSCGSLTWVKRIFWPGSCLIRQVVKRGELFRVRVELRNPFHERTRAVVRWSRPKAGGAPGRSR